MTNASCFVGHFDHALFLEAPPSAVSSCFLYAAFLSGFHITLSSSLDTSLLSYVIISGVFSE
jgi:hypothetical protein